MIQTSISHLGNKLIAAIHGGWKAGSADDTYPTPNREYYAYSSIKPEEWFYKILDNGVSLLFFFNDYGACGVLGIKDKRHAKRMHKAQSKGYRFITLTERAKQAVPYPLQS